MTVHLSWEAINDVADGRLTPAEQAQASAHMAGCTECAAQLASLRALLTAADDAPDHIEAPAAAWDEVRRTIESGKTVSFPAEVRREPGFRISRTGLAAAAVVLMAASSVLTAVVMRRQGVAAAAGADRAATGGALVTMASEVDVIEREYLSTASQLRAALDKERASLAPATIATVERNLRVIDDAIAEAREALAQDPASTALRELLRKNHQQKIDFLRRTTALLQRA